MLTLKKTWRSSPPLTAAGLLMLLLVLPTALAIGLDGRIIGGAPAWLKPMKFAVSTAIYVLTLAWMFRFLTQWPRLRAIAGWITALILIMEVGVIYAQAARGTTSHFNIGTPLDALLFSIMGVGILVAWLTAMAIAFALFRQRFEDPVMGWALRLGMLIMVVGAGTGGLMTSPTKAQLAEARVTHKLKISGAHTVGAPDGGPGLPMTGWSTRHGDLRVPHFLGLHALQVLPLIAWAWKPKHPRGIIWAGLGYGLLFVFALVQALAGKPLFES